ncbi:hypothetical protein LINPERHAP1_LOCUS21626 [Linum perenne]
MNILLCLMLVEGWHQESSEHKAGILETMENYEKLLTRNVFPSRNILGSRWSGVGPKKRFPFPLGRMKNLGQSWKNLIVMLHYQFT